MVIPVCNYCKKEPTLYYENVIQGWVCFCVDSVNKGGLCKQLSAAVGYNKEDCINNWTNIVKD